MDFYSFFLPVLFAKEYVVGSHFNISLYFSVFVYCIKKKKKNLKYISEMVLDRALNRFFEFQNRVFWLCIVQDIGSHEEICFESVTQGSCYVSLCVGC